MRDIVPLVNDMRKHLIGFDSIFDDLVHRPFASFEMSYPKDNIFKTENTIEIELALAGFSKDDIEITRDGANLTVAGGKDFVENDEDRTYVRQNIAYRSFTKCYTIATEYKDIQAEFVNGILHIKLEKEAVEQPKKLIEIK